MVFLNLLGLHVVVEGWKYQQYTVYIYTQSLQTGVRVTFNTYREIMFTQVTLLLYSSLLSAQSERPDKAKISLFLCHLLPHILDGGGKGWGSGMECYNDLAASLESLYTALHKDMMSHRSRT